MSYNVQPQPVAQADPVIVLDQNFAANAMAEMQRLGAKNAQPPLPPSTHLKNINTGIIFPWSPALAEQRDILVNCDANGNTDPAVWQQTMLSEQSIPDQSELMRDAYANLHKTQSFTPAPSAQQPLDEPPNKELTAESAQSLKQLSQMMD